MTNYRLFPSTNGPSAATAFTGNYQAGMSVKVTSSPVYLNGYWWWCCNTGQSTSPVTFALWSIAPNAVGGQNPAYVPNSTVTSGTLTAGSWNFTALSPALALAPGLPYRATVGMVNAFPDTNSQFGASQPYAAGITNGPLTAYSDSGGSLPLPYGDKNQATFALANSPTTVFPGTGSSSFNSWLDVQVTDTLQPGTTYRVWPNYPQGGLMSTDISGYTLGMEVTLSQACPLLKIWHWSPSGCTVLPTRCLIWDVATQLAVSGTDNTSPAWKDPSGSAASPGDGWIYCDYSGAGVTLQSGKNYKVSTFRIGGSGNFWFGVTTHYWDTGDGASGRTFGPLTALSNAAASPGQNSWNVAAFGYPNTSSSPENDWVDVEVGAPVTVASSLLMASGII